MIEHHWYTNPVVLATIITACALQLLIARRLPEGRHVMRTHAGFAAIGLALTGLGQLLPDLGPPGRIDILAELVLIGWGILFIRILCIFFFRIIMPAISFMQPRILHEIVFVLACITWGLVRLHSAGLNLGGLITTSAAITAIIAFSMQETLGNILGGLALQLDKSFHIGDWVMIDNLRGKIVEVHWRHTAMLTPAGEIIVLPNSLMMKSKVTVISSVDSPIARRNIMFSTPDNFAPQHVIGAVEKALRDVSLAQVASHPAPDCIVTDYKDGNIWFTVRYWLLDQQHDGPTDSAVRLHIYSALRRADFRLARQSMDVRVDTDTEERSAALRHEAIEKRIQILASVPLFAGLQMDELHSIAASLRVTPFTRNDVMTRQGAVAHWLYVLISGEADVWFETPSGERRFVATLAPGAVFGEMGMMTGEARTATVSARVDAECYRIDKASFERILQARPELAAELALIISERNSGLDAARIEVQESDLAMDDANVLDRIRRFFHLPSLG